MNEQPSTPQAPKQSFWAKLFGGKKKQDNTNEAVAPQPVTTPVTEQPQTSTVSDVSSPASQFSVSSDAAGVPGASLIGNEIAASTAPVATPAPAFAPTTSPMQPTDLATTPGVDEANEQPVVPVAAPDPVVTPEASVESVPSPSPEVTVPSDTPMASYESVPAAEQPQPVDLPPAAPQTMPEQISADEQTPPPAQTAL